MSIVILLCKTLSIKICIVRYKSVQNCTIKFYYLNSGIYFLEPFSVQYFTEGKDQDRHPFRHKK